MPPGARIWHWAGREISLAMGTETEVQALGRENLNQGIQSRHQGTSAVASSSPHGLLYQLMAFVTLGCRPARVYPGIRGISGSGRVTNICVALFGSSSCKYVFVFETDPTVDPNAGIVKHPQHVFNNSPLQQGKKTQLQAEHDGKLYVLASDPFKSVIGTPATPSFEVFDISYTIVGTNIFGSSSDSPVFCFDTRVEDMHLPLKFLHPELPKTFDSRTSRS
ncbi:hypothetical protein FF1_005609 [Malus domestica]